MFVFLFLTVCLALLTGCKLTRAGYETAAYSVVEKQGQFEIRDYPPMLLATTRMPNRNPMQGDSFRHLFRYISGDNARQQKIAMTTPVFISNQDPKQMSFVLPSSMAGQGAPEAVGKQVVLKETEGGLFATYRFSGNWSAERIEKASHTLEKWIEEKNFHPNGPPQYAFFDPPFTPGFLKRNEVLIRLAE